MAKTASLTSGLVAKKGSATPALAKMPEPEVQPTTRATSTDYYKSLTVKLDRERYEALKTVGVKVDKKSQEIFVEALDLYLSRLGHLPSANLTQDSPMAS